MRPIVVLTTCSAFAFHLLVGCCAHHAHSHEAATRSALPPTADVVHDGGCCHGDEHGHAPPADATPSDAPSEKKCEGSPCTYVVGSNIVPPACEPAFAGLLWLESCLQLPPPLVFSSGHPDDWLDTGPPHRVHLLHCVLLI